MGGLRFTRVKAPDREELEDLVGRIAGRVGRALERMGLLQRDAESEWLDLSSIEDADAMRQLIGSSVTYRIALGPQAGRAQGAVLRTITPLAGEDGASERVAVLLHRAPRGGGEASRGERTGEGRVPAEDAVP